MRPVARQNEGPSEAMVGVSLGQGICALWVVKRDFSVTDSATKPPSAPYRQPSWRKPRAHPFHLPRHLPGTFALLMSFVFLN